MIHAIPFKRKYKYQFIALFVLYSGLTFFLIAFMKEEKYAHPELFKYIFLFSGISTALICLYIFFRIVRIKHPIIIYNGLLKLSFSNCVEVKLSKIKNVTITNDNEVSINLYSAYDFSGEKEIIVDTKNLTITPSEFVNLLNKEIQLWA